MCIELWHIFHDELDLDGNGHLEAEELEHALEKAGTSSCGSLSELRRAENTSRHYVVSFNIV